MSELKKELNFDEAYAALEKTVRAMESPKVTLEESMDLYERACKQALVCRKILDEAKGRVSDIHERVRLFKESGFQDVDLPDASDLPF